MRGPIDYIIIGFKGNKFDGSILSELGAAVDSGVIELISLAVVAKDEDGVVSSLGIADLGDKYLIDFVADHPLKEDGVDKEDINEVADLLEPNTAAGLLVVEHLWAKPLKKAIINAGGFLIADGRIHPEAAEELNAKGE